MQNEVYRDFEPFVYITLSIYSGLPAARVLLDPAGDLRAAAHLPHRLRLLNHRSHHGEVLRHRIPLQVG